MDPDSRAREIAQHLEAIRSLEAEAARSSESESDAPPSWPPSGFYLVWHVGMGMILGILAASVSLVANALAAPLFGRHPLELIRVYLTFPMGERALAADSGTLLTVGCILYLVTGALYGILIHLVLTVFYPEAGKGRLFLVASALSLGLWVLNFYLILSWLQPLLLGGNWIVSMVPPWVGALTHLAFGWTVAAGESLGWGRFEAGGAGAGARGARA